MLRVDEAAGNICLSLSLSFSTRHRMSLTQVTKGRQLIRRVDDVAGNICQALDVGLPDVPASLRWKQSLRQRKAFDSVEWHAAGWLLGTSTRPTSTKPPPLCACVSIHPEGKSCSHVGRVLVLNDPAARTPWRRRPTTTSAPSTSPASGPWAPRSASCSSPAWSRCTRTLTVWTDG